MKPLSLLGIQHILSSPSPLIGEPYMVSMKSDIASRSQACTPLKNLTSQKRTPLVDIISSATLASLFLQNLNKSEYLTARDVSPHNWSCQNFTLDPSPISYRIWRETEGHPWNLNELFSRNVMYSFTTWHFVKRKREREREREREEIFMC